MEKSILHKADLYYATCPRFVEDLLEKELAGLEAEVVKTTLAGVYFRASLAAVYMICYCSRLANRVFLPLARFKVTDRDELYTNTLAVPWHEHFTPENSFAVDSTCKNSFTANSNYAALVVKDAIADYFRQQQGRRPSVQSSQPDLRIHLHLDETSAVVSLDLSGDSLHKRGYRQAGSPATLKENVAAALLLRAGWPAIAAGGGAFLDPMCGSGTLLLEAACMAAAVPAGRLRRYYGFLHWLKHDDRLWQQVKEQAEEQAATEIPVPVIGYDGDKRAVLAALVNCEKAGFKGKIHIEKRDITAAGHPARKDFDFGLLAVNPPYGVRLGDVEDLVALYRSLGEVLLKNFKGWQAVVLTAEERLSHAIGLRAVKVNQFYNGPVKCLLARFEIREEQVFRTYAAPLLPDLANDDLANRLKKNIKQLGKWAKRTNLSCYRLYDADLPEYAAAVDFYEGQYLHIQEYAPPATIDSQKAVQRLRHLVNVLRHLLKLEEKYCFIKQRRRQPGASQYQKQGEAGVFYTVHEHDLQFRVNFTDYLDTGLYLGSREVRGLIRARAAGKDFLNLYCYTAAATVYAAAGGARSTTSVDTGTSYLRWGRENLQLNGFKPDNHALINDDCLHWLETNRNKYHLILLDPPTFSNTKKKERVFDLQEQHVALIKLCLRSLHKDGLLIFANNFRRFKLDAAALADYRLKDCSRATLPEDFLRRPRQHHCWQISH